MTALNYSTVLATSLRPVRTVAPTTYPVTLEEAKDHVGATGYEDDDKKIENMIAAATAMLDGYDGILGRALMTQTWKVTFPDWSYDALRLPLVPVQSVSSVKYYDSDNVLQTFAPSGNWALYQDALSPFVSILSGVSWPTGLYNRLDAIEVTFVAGYGTKPDDVPAPIRSAILLIVGHLFENREQVTIGNMQATELPWGVPQLISPYRIQAL